ncbi:MULTISPECIES: peptide MFS transporter [unclassified Sphingomonas]|uniref:peptide MFS transporter n=1 Tax=unclassified Sphingomonas TaxID=196159 RepID=UPI000E101227|nr:MULTISPECIES: peptide MFS transporter [unclassified Sphingomonas]AXJ96774.1 MFS transporter [Sphingomonas sp. FARSPH]
MSGSAGAREWLGHPVGLFYLAFAEAWERFSYYGMQTLLVLYLTQALLLPPRVGRIALFGPFRALLDSAGTLDIIALSSAIFGLYTSAVYLTPIFGGLLADRVLGKRRTVILGALLMAAGHFLMAFDVTFLFALLLLVLGVGCFKGNIASQVGALYAPEDNRRADAFQIYFIGINAGVIIAPLVCGTLGEKVGWHWGFGAAGVGMLIGLGIYLAGQRYLPDDSVPVAARADVAPTPPMTRRQKQALILLVAMIPVLAISALGNQELYNAYLVWANGAYDFQLLGVRLPTTFLASLDAVASVASLIGVVAFWRWYATRFREPDEIVKLAIGCVISAAAFVIVAVSARHEAATGIKVSLWVAVAIHFINGIGFSNVFPVSLALYSRASPPQFAGTMIGVYYLFLFLANLGVGVIGGFLNKMPPLAFWGLHVALVLGAGAAFVLIKLAFGRILIDERAAA